MLRGPSLALMLLSSVALAAGPAAAADVEMVLTNQIAPNHWASKLMDEYAATIEEKSGGRIDVQVYNSGALFKDKEALASIGTGAVQMVWPVSVQLESIAPEYGVVSLPFTITDELMSKEGAAPELADTLSAMVSGRGMQVMGLMRAGDLVFLFPDKFIESHEDLAGAKIRVTGGKVLQELMNMYGASPVTMPATEMATGLMQGAIDGIFTSYGGWEMVGVSGAQKASLVPGLSLVTYTVVVDKAWLEGLPDDLRQIVEDTTDEMLASQWQRGIEGDRSTREKMIAEGGSLHIVEDGPAMDAFRTLAEEAKQSFIDAYPEVYESAKAFQAKYGD
ncbi:TRAP transporter substrate-binding protein DctP [Acuticoccus sp. I52.16.1]|uniref:TRAP transporter substrate-binding protein DctP n=1 Tax=Acuticoccus sp. I52.16.1 TaxID=2928472 RepID=UPI001FD40002|nr:TRAP transporter substrate-binding protein DctP [Acuticoccus sp. I52.16.1]UOM32967.1 TRAP transporter substrate-binding protein DctP [Acuticoccus sp. I52.16.1]